MKTLLIIFILFFSSLVVAEDISDFEIEGISVGDSLLDYMSEDEIKKEIDENRYMYERLTEEFGEVYLFTELQTYEFMSFFVKTDDEKFLIYSIRGGINFIEDMKGCISKLNNIAEEVSSMFQNAEKTQDTIKHDIDPTGRSIIEDVTFYLDSGDIVSVQCTNFEESLRIKNNWTEGLNVSIRALQIYEWFYPNK
tara:strand:+ start:316 stop:900 length:585 start_codon:yes stop_codon:yes gene_type:complete